MQTILKTTIVTIALTAIMAIPASAITQAECQQIQQAAHTMAECARQLGYPEDSVIIQEAQKKWWEAQNSLEAQNAVFVWDRPILTAIAGTIQGPSGKETYYNLPMHGVVNRMRRLGYDDENWPYWVRSDGAKMLGDKIMVAANLNVHPRGSVVDTSLGCGLVCDTGGFAKHNPYQIDIATNWR